VGRCRSLRRGATTSPILSANWRRTACSNECYTRDYAWFCGRASMGPLANLYLALLPLAGILLWSLVMRDVYACLPSLQLWLIRRAVNRLPEMLREQYLEQWHADLLDLPPSEVLRTFFAVDCFRGAIMVRVVARSLAGNALAANGGAFIVSLRPKIRLVGMLGLGFLTAVTFFFFGALVRIAIGPVSLPSAKYSDIPHAYCARDQVTRHERCAIFFFDNDGEKWKKSMEAGSSG